MSQLSPRAAQILAALVAEYIDTGEPIGSAHLTQVAGLRVSSATVRNTLAELEDLGYLQQPHTSAGRVPTDRGYRFYVDQLLAEHAAPLFRRFRLPRLLSLRLHQGANLHAVRAHPALPNRVARLVPVSCRHWTSR